MFGVLIVARRPGQGFSSGECEFLRQLSEHVALAAQQAQLYSALQRAYDDLRQTQQMVAQQERLKALGQMASGIAHDINNAITPLALCTEVLLDTEPNLSDDARATLGMMQHAIDDVAHTVAGLRDFYRERESQPALADVNLNALVKEVVDLTRARWSDMPQQRGVAIGVVTELAYDAPMIQGVESELRQALINLVFNAVDAMPDGGTITLRTRRLARRQRLGAGSIGSRSRSPTPASACPPRRGSAAWSRSSPPRASAAAGSAWPWSTASSSGTAPRSSWRATPGRGTTVRLTFAGAVGRRRAASGTAGAAPRGAACGCSSSTTIRCS